MSCSIQTPFQNQSQNSQVSLAGKTMAALSPSKKLESNILVSCVVVKFINLTSLRQSCLVTNRCLIDLKPH